MAAADAAAEMPATIEFYVGEDKAGPGLKEAKVEGQADNLIYLPEKPVLTRDDVAAVSLGNDSRGNAAVDITFTDRGAAKMSKASGENVGKRMAVVVDGQAVFAAVIRSKISDRAQITIGTKSTAEKLVQAISPAPEAPDARRQPKRLPAGRWRGSNSSGPKSPSASRYPRARRKKLAATAAGSSFPTRGAGPMRTGGSWKRSIIPKG